MQDRGWTPDTLAWGRFSCLERLSLHCRFPCFIYIIKVPTHLSLLKSLQELAITSWEPIESRQGDLAHLPTGLTSLAFMQNGFERATGAAAAPLLAIGGPVALTCARLSCYWDCAGPWDVSGFELGKLTELALSDFTGYEG